MTKTTTAPAPPDSLLSVRPSGATDGAQGSAARPIPAEPALAAQRATSPPVARPTTNGATDSSPVASLNLYQKLAKISQAVQIKATGRTAQGAKAMSIADVEEALGPLLAEHGIVVDYTWNADTKIVAEQGRAQLWLADITIRATDSADPNGGLYARSIDIGTSPSAAVSFAIKRYLRALFHLADEEDETRQTGTAKVNGERVSGDNPASSKHLTAEQTTELKALNKLCPAPVPDGLGWDSLVAGRSFDWIKNALLARKASQEKREEA